jgi:anti-sigma factor RsiW
MMSNELTCQEIVELITDYLEAALPDLERVRIEEHLSSCTGCRNYLAQMRQTIHTLGKLPEESIPDSVRDELLTLFRGWKQESAGES